MKAQVANWQRVAHCLRAVARDGTTLRIVSYPYDMAMSNGEIYRSDFGYEFSGLDQKDGSSPAVMDLEGFLKAGGIDRDGIESGRWDGARLYLFATDWSAPVEDEEPMACFIFGQTQVTDHGYTIEMMQLIDALNQPTGRVETALCPWTLFDETLDGKVLPYQKSRCSGPRGSSEGDGPNIEDYKVTGTISAVSSKSEFADALRAEDDDWFAKGEIKFTTGANAGLPALKIKAYEYDSSTGGVFVLHGAAHYPVQIGDEYVAIPGCRKRRVVVAEDGTETPSDCIVKFGNAINFGGCDTVPDLQVVTKVGGVSKP